MKLNRILTTGELLGLKSAKESQNLYGEARVRSPQPASPNLISITYYLPAPRGHSLAQISKNGETYHIKPYRAAFIVSDQMRNKQRSQIGFKILIENSETISEHV